MTMYQSTDTLIITYHSTQLSQIQRFKKTIIIMYLRERKKMMLDTHSYRSKIVISIGGTNRWNLQFHKYFIFDSFKVFKNLLAFFRTFSKIIPAKLKSQFKNEINK